MLLYFRLSENFYVVEVSASLTEHDISKLVWLFSGAERINTSSVDGIFIGPRKEMITPWSTNAVEITRIMGIRGVTRIEEFKIEKENDPSFDPMLQHVYRGLDQEVFTIHKQPDPVIFVSDIEQYNIEQGLALSTEEVNYLLALSEKVGRPLTDSEVFGFSQVNSEHCRHKIFNGIFIIDDQEMPETLFDLIRKTSKKNPGNIISAYKDNVAFIKGPEAEQFAPQRPDIPDFFIFRDFESVISLKAETHNFPTTVEPFNGAATGSGGEIRDRMAGGKGSIPLAGTAVYMTSYPRLNEGRSWEKKDPPRPWLYKTPEEILIKASNGASDFGNKFGQPLICGSVLTFEHRENEQTWGYDKVIMLAGGIGFAKKCDSLKEKPGPGEMIVILGGDNYRIGMGGGAVSSVATGQFENAIELNAVQRSNPEMQKRVFNAIRALCEADHNPIVSIHDHGAGGHLNSLSELVEETGGIINIDKLPVGDPTLSEREIISNESQERMGLLVHPDELELLRKIAERERAPVYVVGKTNDDQQLVFHDNDNHKPIDLSITDFFGKPPRTIIADRSAGLEFLPVQFETNLWKSYLEQVLQLESVACKDWLTNKVDRAVSGKVAKQQTCGTIQLPLNNIGVMAIDYRGNKGIATSIGHAPVAAMINSATGSRLAVAESLTNLVWAPLTHGLKGVSLSANWMWPCRQPGEDARLYQAVKAVSDFAIALGINIPTGKDSLSMTQKYPDGSLVSAPGTLIISAVAEVENVRRVIGPALINAPGTTLFYIDFSCDGFHLGGSSFAQVLNRVGEFTPDIIDQNYFVKAFETLQQLIQDEMIFAGHDISAGGLITTLLEMTFPELQTGMNLDFSGFDQVDLIPFLFSEKPGVVIQVEDREKTIEVLSGKGIRFQVIGEVISERKFFFLHRGITESLDIDKERDLWFRTSYLLDCSQSGSKHALERYRNYSKQPLEFRFHQGFSGNASSLGIDLSRRKPSGIRAAIIREKGVNRDRDMAFALYAAGFDVKDVHMTDLVSGRETLEDVNLIAFVGGFSNSDVLGSAKGWAGAFIYNSKAKQALTNFMNREDTLSVGVCNGCQLMVELGLIFPGREDHPEMSWNDSHKYEVGFITLDIHENHSVMLKTLAGSRLGIWVAHGEGKFNFASGAEKYHIPATYSYQEYPGNPNGSAFNAACICSDDGRHLAIMPHLEDSVFPWQWPHYPSERSDEEITPWMEAFVNAREWIRNRY